ncbi:MAG: histidinol-phosphate transaminase [Chloroflexota bacterium]
MTQEGIERLVRPELRQLAGYSAAKSPETLDGKTEVPVEDIVKLDANENPYGCSPRVSQALASYGQFHIYPDSGQMELRKNLGGYAGVEPERIVAGNGSNQLIDLIVRLFVGTGDEVINSVPTFDIYRFSTQVQGGTLVPVPRDRSFAVDVEAVKKAITPRTRLIFLANPNNPTGNLMPGQDIKAVLETGLPVVVDEAYYEFSGETVVPWVTQYPNLMVLRSFSKWTGLAGLRVGYGIFPPRIAEYLQAIKVPYNVNTAAQIAVRESVKDIASLQEKVKAILTERDRLYQKLQQIEWLQIFPSRANFILCRVLKGEAKELAQRLQNKGILVRYFDTPRLRDYIRVSVGKPEHSDILIRVLRELWETICC